MRKRLIERNHSRKNTRQPYKRKDVSVKEVKELIEGLLPILNKHGDVYFVGRIIGTIDNQPKFGEWVIASVRLPDDPEGGIPRGRDELEDAYVKDRIKEYIVMIDGASMPTALFYGGEGRWYDCNGTQEICRVVAWQPLPEPYRG